METTTNRKFTQNRIFIKACELAGVEPTTRQASKFRSGRGISFKFKHKAANILSGN
jgi:hypothetical protein